MNWNKLKKKLAGDKGYYLALAVCAAAVAVSGWLFVRSLDRTDEELAGPEAVQAAVLPTLNPRNEDRGELWKRTEGLRPGQDAEAENAGRNAGTVRSGQDSRTGKDGLAAGADQTGAEGPSGAAVGQSAGEEAELLICRPVEGAVVQRYSMDRLAYNGTTRDWRTHAGMDLAAPAGSEVRAAAEGTVAAVYEDELLGQTVAVEHPGGWVTHYANLAEEIAVSAGDRVEAGQVLGTVGRTALAELGSEPHLHFAVYRNNVPQDPEAFLAG